MRMEKTIQLVWGPAGYEGTATIRLSAVEGYDDEEACTITKALPTARDQLDATLTALVREADERAQTETEWLAEVTRQASNHGFKIVGG